MLNSNDVASFVCIGRECFRREKVRKDREIHWREKVADYLLQNFLKI